MQHNKTSFKKRRKAIPVS